MRITIVHVRHVSPNMFSFVSHCRIATRCLPWSLICTNLTKARRYLSRANGDVRREPFPLHPNRAIDIVLSKRRRYPRWKSNAPLKLNHRITNISIDLCQPYSTMDKIESSTISSSPRREAPRRNPPRISISLIKNFSVGQLHDVSHR